jgi:uncharacterized phage-associated protein
MASAHDVANYIVKSMSVDNLKLQKLLYYSQAVHLVLYDKTPLFPESIEAWDYGPVVPPVYREYKRYGLDALPYLDESVTIDLSSEEIEAVSLVLGYYGEMTSLELVNKTHQELPWKQSYTPGLPSHEIPIDLIYDYFKENLIFNEE